MANNYASGTMQPEIPNRLMAPLESWLLNRIFDNEVEGDMTYYFAEEGIHSIAFLDGDDRAELVDAIAKSTALCPDLCDTVNRLLSYTKENDDLDLDKIDWSQIVLGIVNRHPKELPFVTFEEAFHCSKMRPGEFGGAATFISPDGVFCTSTPLWLSRMQQHGSVDGFRTFARLGEMLSAISSALEDTITTHIYDVGEEPEDAPERKLVEDAEALVKEARAIGSDLCFPTDAHEELVIGLRDMIDNGRLTEAMVPDDFFWLQTKLKAIGLAGLKPETK